LNKSGRNGIQTDENENKDDQEINSVDEDGKRMVKL
jgi:hypothetical protein